MRTKVWNNTTFTQIPDGGDVNWPLLTDFLVALADNAQTTNFQKSTIRTATTTPVTVVAASDHVVVTNLSVAGAVAVTLPAGVNGQEFVIIDGKQDAATNNITITPNGAQTINGAATLVINISAGGYKLKYSTTGTDWKILESITGSNSGITATGANQGVSRLQNKDLDDTSVWFVDNSDTTKRIKFDAGGTTGTSTTITAAQTANRVLTVPDATTTIVGHNVAQVLTLKDYDGGTASNTNRTTLAKDTLTNLTALTRKQGNFLYDTTNAVPVYDDGSNLISVRKVATATTPGTVTSFAPTVASSFLVTTNASYTVLDNDNYDKLFFSTGASTRTLLLPSLASNLGRTLYISKIDTGVGILTVDGASAETINGAATFSLYGQYEAITIFAQTTGWVIINFGSMPWQTFTPTGTWVTNATWSGTFKKVGDQLYVRSFVSVATGGVTGSYTQNTPNSLTIDTAKLLITSNNVFAIGGVGTARAAAVNYFLTAGYSSSTAVRAGFYNDDAALGLIPAGLSATAPDVFANTDFVYLEYSVPVVTT